MLKNVFKVRVVAGENGELLQINPNKGDYASLRFDQVIFTLRNGFLDKKNKVTFITGRVEPLREFINASGLQAGTEVPGCIYTIETFSPQYEGHQPKINPTTGRVVLIEGAMVFEKTFFDPSGTKNDHYLDGIRTAGDQIVDPTTLKLPAALATLNLSSDN